MSTERLSKRPRSENDKTDTKEENSSLHCVHDGQKDGRKMSETFQETPVECSNSAEASGEEHLFVERPEELRESNPHASDEKTFTVDHVFNKPNDQVVMFVNDVSKYRSLLTTKRPAAIMLHGVVMSTVRSCLLFGLNRVTG